MKDEIRITFLAFCFNEESRIGDVLAHAVQWADEVLVFDKDSTDRTRAICRAYSPRVRLVEIPFSPQGNDDIVAASRIPVNDWIWYGTCSEIPTRKIIEYAKMIISGNPNLDLIYVPRKIYSFGCDIPESPWGIARYPFLVNRSKAIITNTVHNNFHPRDHANTAEIPYSEDCCVHHFTHANAKSYLSAMAQYFEAESQRPEQAEIINNALKNLSDRKDLRSLLGSDAFGLECAWRSYWLGVALHGWERLRGLDVVRKYASQKRQLVEKEWPHGSFPSADCNARSENAGSENLSPSLVVPLSPIAEERLDESTEDFLLHELRGRPLSRMVKTVFQIGAHRFQEKKILFEIFPNLAKVVLFEPLPELFKILSEQEASDNRIIVLPYAISSSNGTVPFYVADNDGASSSIMPFGEHRKLFPQVRSSAEIFVQTRTLEHAIEQHGLPMPDFLFLDVQGAEFKILSSLQRKNLERIKMIYTEASTSEIYLGAETLDKIRDVLLPEMAFAGYCPLSAETPNHGNALFVNNRHLWLLYPNEQPRSFETVPLNTFSRKFGALCRRLFSKKIVGSLRKRLRTIERALGS